MGQCALWGHGPSAAARALRTSSPAHPETPIPQYMVMVLVVFFVGTLGTLWLRPKLSVGQAGGDAAGGGDAADQSDGIWDRGSAGGKHRARRTEVRLPMVGSVAVFILLANLLSVFPTLRRLRRQEVTVPLGCAIVTFLYFNWQGIRHHGVGGYLHTFAGAPRHVGDWALGILLFPGGNHQPPRRACSP